MRLLRLNLAAYGRCADVGIDIGENVTVVVGANEAGKSTALDALTDLLWGIPPRSVRASDFTQSQLRIDAALELDDEACTLVRKSTGLFADNLVTAVSAPWDPQTHLSREWWRTRMGINHEDLQETGRKTFSGAGDIADIIFAAREGRSAREILGKITDRIDQLFKQHKGAKSVLLRVAEKGYDEAVADRANRLTLASDVVEQRAEVTSLTTKLNQARESVKEASRALRTAREDERVVPGVLELRQARAEVELLDAEGDRLSPSELADYTEAKTALQDCDRNIAQLDSKIEAKAAEIDALSVDDNLLDDEATLSRLQSETQARVDELRRADQEFGPAAAAETERLQALLRSIGIESADGVEAALNRAAVRSDHAATLDDLAERIERIEQKRNQALDDRDRALGDLASKGIAVELSSR